MIRTAIIGVSGFGATIYDDLMKQAGEGVAKINAASIINQDEERCKCAELRAMGCNIYEDYREMLEKEKDCLDICFIPTGIHLHAPMTVCALEHGINVFVEKPIAATLDELRDMKEAEKSSGRFIAVGYQTMYARETGIMKNRILAGDIGRLKSIKCHALWSRNSRYYSRNKWAGRLKCDGRWVLDSPFNNALAHQLNMIAFLAGDSEERSADIDTVEAELYRGNRIESTDTACIRALTSRKIALGYYVTHCTDKHEGPVIRVSGDKGTISWTQRETRFSIGDEEEALKSESYETLRPSMMRQVFRKISDNRSFVCGSDIAGVQTLIVNAAHKSSDIHKIPDEYIVRSKNEKGQSVLRIRDMKDIFTESVREEKLFSEKHVPWSRKGRLVKTSEMF